MNSTHLPPNTADIDFHIFLSEIAAGLQSAFWGQLEPDAEENLGAHAQAPIAARRISRNGAAEVPDELW